MIQALTRAQVIAKWPVGSEFTLEDLLSGNIIKCKGSPPINYDHSDWQYLTKSDYDLMMKIAGRTWTGRPAILRTPSGCESAVSFHTVNHSIRVASGAYDIVSPLITRTTEKDKNGNWVPGHHMCMHYSDSWKARSDSSYTRDMRAKVETAVTLANKNPNPDLARGSTNAAKVKEAQELLNKHGADPKLTVDGGFGALTEKAVFDFQARYTLPQTGIINEATWNALRGDIKKDAPKIEEVPIMTIYNKVEQIPEWARSTIEDLVTNRIITGTNNVGHDLNGVKYGDLNINEDLLRSIIINVKLGKTDISKIRV